MTPPHMPQEAGDNSNPESPPFEESLAELQEITHALEEGALGLEESMRRFERGITLLRQCYKTLEQAEQRIEVLTGMDAAGNPVTAPFDASATIEQTGSHAAGRRKRRKAEAPTAPAEETPEPDRRSDPEPDPRDPEARLF